MKTDLIFKAARILAPTLFGAIGTALAFSYPEVFVALCGGKV